MKLIIVAIPTQTNQDNCALKFAIIKESILSATINKAAV